MTRILDLVRLRVILENVRTWAMRELRPWISTHIDLWKEHFPRVTITASGSRVVPVPTPIPNENGGINREPIGQAKHKDDIWLKGIKIRWLKDPKRSIRVKLPNPRNWGAHSDVRYYQPHCEDAHDDSSSTSNKQQNGRPTATPGPSDESSNSDDWEDTDWGDTDWEDTDWEDADAVEESREGSASNRQVCASRRTSGRPRDGNLVIPRNRARRRGDRSRRQKPVTTTA